MTRTTAFAAIPLLLSLAAPAVVAAHADLVSSNVTDGQTVVGGELAAFTVTFSEDLADGSKLELVGTGVDAVAAWTTGDGATMTLPAPDPLPAGDYELRWTSIAGDGDLLRGVIHVTVVAPTPAPTEPPTAAPTEPPATAPSVAPSAAPTSAPTDGAAGAGADTVIPLAALVIVVLGGGLWWLRSRTRARA
jgi:methionine-rich copper-binding protein CopC